MSQYIISLNASYAMLKIRPACMCMHISREIATNYYQYDNIYNYFSIQMICMKKIAV